MTLDKAHCPTCGQWVQTYRRSITTSMAAILVGAAHNDDDWIHIQRDIVPPLVQQGLVPAMTGDYGKLRFWGLLMPHHTARGFWSVTTRGFSFVEARVTVPEYALVYNNNLIELAGDPILITQVKGFDLQSVRFALGES